MNYTLRSDHRKIRLKFLDSFIPSYAEFCTRHPGMFTGEEFARRFMWELPGPEAREISFADAVEFLKKQGKTVMFLTEAPECYGNDVCRLGKMKEYVAEVSAVELAECAAYEWFTDYALAEQGRYLADPILPSEVYIFDETYAWCLILTHETDETETAESRLCLLVENKVCRVSEDTRHVSGYCRPCS